MIKEVRKCALAVLLLLCASALHAQEVLSIPIGINGIYFSPSDSAESKEEKALYVLRMNTLEMTGYSVRSLDEPWKPLSQYMLKHWDGENNRFAWLVGVGRGCKTIVTHETVQISFHQNQLVVRDARTVDSLRSFPVSSMPLAFVGGRYALQKEFSSESQRHLFIRLDIETGDTTLMFSSESIYPEEFFQRVFAIGHFVIHVTSPTYALYDMITGAFVASGTLPLEMKTALKHRTPGTNQNYFRPWISADAKGNVFCIAADGLFDRLFRWNPITNELTKLDVQSHLFMQAPRSIHVRSDGELIGVAFHDTLYVISLLTGEIAFQKHLPGREATLYWANDGEHLFIEEGKFIEIVDVSGVHTANAGL